MVSRSCLHIVSALTKTSGTAKGQLVYAGQGKKIDFDFLQSTGIDFTGKIWFVSSYLSANIRKILSELIIYLVWYNMEGVSVG